VIKFVCEVPTAIDQRLFALARDPAGDGIARAAAAGALTAAMTFPHLLWLRLRFRHRQVGTLQPSVPSEYQATLG